MFLDRQKVWMDGQTELMDGRTDGAKTISLQLRQEIIKACFKKGKF